MVSMKPPPPFTEDELAEIRAPMVANLHAMIDMLKADGWKTPLGAPMQRTEEQLRAFVEAYAKGYSGKHMEEELGISRQAIEQMLRSVFSMKPSDLRKAERDARKNRLTAYQEQTEERAFRRTLSLLERVCSVCGFARKENPSVPIHKSAPSIGIHKPICEKCRNAVQQNQRSRKLQNESQNADVSRTGLPWSPEEERLLEETRTAKERIDLAARLRRTFFSLQNRLAVLRKRRKKKAA